MPFTWTVNISHAPPWPFMASARPGHHKGVSDCKLDGFLVYSRLYIHKELMGFTLKWICILLVMMDACHLGATKAELSVHYRPLLDPWQYILTWLLGTICGEINLLSSFLGILQSWLQRFTGKTVKCWSLTLQIRQFY